MPKPPKGKTLNEREEAFCRAYVVGWNGTRAALDAGYSKKTARFIASQNLTKLNIRARIKELMKDKLMEQEEVMARLADMARTDMSELAEPYDVPVLDKDGNHLGDRQMIRLKPEAFERYGHLIKSITPASTGGFKIEVYSAKEALELIGKHHNLFTERDDEGNPLTDEQRIARAVAIFDAARARRTR
jgi:terminase small subunit-like protein